MPVSDLQTIDAVYASGLDSARLPPALEATSRLLGAAGAILEVIDKLTNAEAHLAQALCNGVTTRPYATGQHTRSTRSIRISNRSAKKLVAGACLN